MKITTLILAVLLFGCEYTHKVEFKKTFDECYANIPVESRTDGDILVVDPSLIEACYDTAMQLHSVAACKLNGACE
jgi:hypothetical protein